MIRILWQSKSPLVISSFLKKEISPKANGGNFYDIQAILTLDDDPDIEISVDPGTVKKENEGIFKYFTRMMLSKQDSMVVIREPFPLVFSRINKNSINICMIHHIDEKLFSSSIKHKLYFFRLRRQLNKQDLIVTVSKYWKEYLAKRGCSNIEVIYNSNDPKDFLATEEEKAIFKKKYNLKNNKPIIYIGNASREKGVYDVFHSLKDFEYQLVMTGAENNALDLPVQFMHLSRREFIVMLNCCDAVITFSKMIEGWNRIAHEAMLCKVPVIGSGVGGMKELLQGGKQLVAESANQIPSLVEYCLQNRKVLGENGHSFVKKYDSYYFSNAWRKTIKSI